MIYTKYHREYRFYRDEAHKKTNLSLERTLKDFSAVYESIANKLSLYAEELDHGKPIQRNAETMYGTRLTYLKEFIAQAGGLLWQADCMLQDIKVIKDVLEKRLADDELDRIKKLGQYVRETAIANITKKENEQ